MIGAMKNSREDIQKNKNRTSILSSNPTSAYLSKRTEFRVLKIYLHSLFIAALVTKVKIWKQPKCPSMDEWIKKMWYYIQWSIYHSALKKKEFLNLRTNTAWFHLCGI